MARVLLPALQPTHTRQTLVDWHSAALVRWTDDHNHFDHAPRTTRDLEPAIMDYHERSSDALRRIVYQGSTSSRRTL